MENDRTRSMISGTMTPESGLDLTSQMRFNAACSSAKTAVAPIINVIIPTPTAQIPLPNPREDSMTCWMPRHSLKLADDLVLCRVRRQKEARYADGNQQHRRDGKCGIKRQRSRQLERVVVPPFTKRELEQLPARFQLVRWELRSSVLRRICHPLYNRRRSTARGVNLVHKSSACVSLAEFHRRKPDARVTLRLDQRRRNIFGRPGVDAAAEFAVPHAVEKINC